MLFDIKNGSPTLLLETKSLFIQIFEELGTFAQKRLKNLGYSKVRVEIADGYYGWPEEAPFDAIIVTCAASHIPPPYLLFYPFL